MGIARGVGSLFFCAALFGCSSKHSPEPEESRGPCGWTELETQAQLDALVDLKCTKLQALSVTGDEIESLEGLETVQSIDENLWIEASRLRSLRGLDGVRAVGGFVHVSGSAALTSLDGPRALETVGGQIFINETSLADITGLGHVARAEHLFLSDNPHLTTLGSLLDWPRGAVKVGMTISGNPALPQCQVDAFAAAHTTSSGCACSDNGDGVCE